MAGSAAKRSATAAQVSTRWPCTPPRSVKKAVNDACTATDSSRCSTRHVATVPASCVAQAGAPSHPMAGSRGGGQVTSSGVPTAGPQASWCMSRST
jgi:hypothetical protein